MLIAMSDTPRDLESSKLAAPRRQLSLFDSTCIIVGIIIGAGIYEAVPLVAGATGGLWPSTLCWLAGGLIVMVGAACYAELATTWPREGGDYVYLTKAFGRRAGFLFAWAEFWVVRPGNVGAMAYVFARYAGRLYPLGAGRMDHALYACGAIGGMTLVNLMGVRTGKWTQNLLTVAKVVGLSLIVGVGLLGPLAADNASTAGESAGATAGAATDELAAPVDAPPLNFQFAMIMVLFCYGGWSDMSYVAAEVRDPQRNILRALGLGTLAVMLIYMALNLAMIHGLGYAGVASSSAVSADLLRLRLGETGEIVISALICVSCLGAINGMLFTGSRVYYAVGTEHRFYRWLGRWNARLDTPVWSLLMQMSVTLGLVIGFGMYENGFSRLVVFTAPFFYTFFLLVGLSLPVLRWREPDTPRPFRAFLYPLTPILFCASSLFLLYSSVTYAVGRVWEVGAYELLWSLAILAVGVVLSCFNPPTSERSDRRASAP